MENCPAVWPAKCICCFSPRGRSKIHREDFENGKETVEEGQEAFWREVFAGQHHHPRREPRQLVCPRSADSMGRPCPGRPIFFACLTCGTVTKTLGIFLRLPQSLLKVDPAPFRLISAVVSRISGALLREGFSPPGGEIPLGRASCVRTTPFFFVLPAYKGLRLFWPPKCTVRRQAG